MSCRGAIALSLFVAITAHAQPISDDFESGTFAKWVERRPIATDQLTLTSAAARRGSFGMQLLDTTGGVGSEANNLILYDFPTDPGAALTLRYSMRIVSSNDAGYFTPGAVEGSAGLIGDLTVLYPGGNLELQTGDRLGVFSHYDTLLIPDGGWHDYRLELRGVGSDAGTAEAFMDEVSGGVQAVDWSGVTIVRVALGETYGLRAWKGELSFDDVASGPPVDAGFDAGAVAGVDGGTDAGDGTDAGMVADVDGGTAGSASRGRGELAVGCACGSGNGLEVGLMALLSALGTRRWRRSK